MPHGHASLRPRSQAQADFWNPTGFYLVTGDALDVDPQQHVHAVARPLSDLESGHAGVQPSRHSRVLQVIGAPGQ